MTRTDLLDHDRYRVEQPIGQGAMGTVLLARDTVLERVVAVKVLADHLAADDTFRSRFIQEARLAARLCHPNVVQVFDAGDDGRPFLVMEYVDGETVAQRLARHVGFSAEELVGLGAQLSAGLAHAHARGIVHRDVKPHNVLLRGDGVAKLTDFGIARAVEEAGLTEIGTVVGTAAFMAPEQAAGQPAGPAADVYGLGAVLRHAAGGSLPPGLAALVDAALAPDPAARPSAEELHQQLAAMADGAIPFDPPAVACSSETAPTELVAPGAAPAEMAPAALLGPTVVAAPTVLIDRTEVGAAPGSAAPPSTGLPHWARRFVPDTWPLARVALAVAVLIVLLAVAINARGSGGGTAASRSVAPVPAGADPAQTAQNLATWLRSQGD
jgi:serine/threonine-protein kinase